MEVAQVDRAFHNLHNSPFPVSGNSPLYFNDQIQIHGILGCDLIPLLGVLELCEIEGGSLLRLSNGYTLFGDVSFIASAVPSVLTSPQPFQSQLDPLINGSPHYPQIRNLKGSKPLRARVKLANSTCASRKTNRTKSIPRRRTTDLPKSLSKTNLDSENARLVNFALNASPSYVSLYDDVFPESCVTQGLENFFSLESIGVSPTTSSYDDRYIEEFDSNVEFRDGNYFVALPWHRETLREVPSNFQLAKTIAYKVAKRNASQNLEEAYNQAFADQLARGIISEISIDQINPSECIWIPHRPVVKTDPLTTTMVRPMFNCSLKVRGKPFLNEAAFPSIDIMAKLLDLLNYFRTNRYTLLADIQKAFLNIYLKLQEDRNRFSFVVFPNGSYHYYQSQTIIFGFV